MIYSIWFPVSLVSAKIGYFFCSLNLPCIFFSLKSLLMPSLTSGTLTSRILVLLSPQAQVKCTSSRKHPLSLSTTAVYFTCSTCTSHLCFFYQRYYLYHYFHFFVWTPWQSELSNCYILAKCNKFMGSGKWIKPITYPNHNIQGYIIIPKTIKYFT